MLEQSRNSIVFKYIRHLIFRYRYAELSSMSAEIAYYLILAFFPFLFFLINVLSFTPLSTRLLIVNFNTVLPNETAVLVKNLLVETVQAKSTVLLLLGMVGSLWATSQGMAAIIRGLNHSYQVKETRNIFRLKVMAIVSTILVSVMVISSFVMIVFGRMIGSYLVGLYGGKTLFFSIWPYIRYGISLSFLFATFVLIYRYLPNRKLKLRHILPGTLFATLGWVCASLLFAYYVNSFEAYEKIYGSLGGIVCPDRVAGYHGFDHSPRRRDQRDEQP